MNIEITETAEEDLERLANPVRDTFYSKVQSTRKNLNIGASPSHAFNKYLSGNMNPVLQMNLGRDFRAWFLEGKYLPDNFDKNTVYCMMILTKKEAKSLTKKITDPISFLQSDL